MGRDVSFFIFMWDFRLWLLVAEGLKFNFAFLFAANAPHIIIFGG